jgi:predicted dehydrogenase
MILALESIWIKPDNGKIGRVSCNYRRAYWQVVTPRLFSATIMEPKAFIGIGRSRKEQGMTVKFGIAGLGSISTRFATALNTIEGVELVAVAARDQARSNAFAQQFNAKRAYQNYANLMTDDDVDIIYIGLTHNFHYDVTKACLEHHKAVLCEKPLVLTRKDAEALVALADQNHTLLMEALWTRCLPAFQKAREWVIQGTIGQVKLIVADFSYKSIYDPKSRQYDPLLAGGSLFDVGVYPINLATGLLGEFPAAVGGLAKIAPSGVDESAAFSLRFSSGALASLTCGFTVNAMGPSLIYGTQSHIVLENCFGPRTSELYDEDNNLLDRFEDPEPEGFVYQIRHCVDLFCRGQVQSDLIPWQDTIACADIFDDLRGQWGLA